MPHKVWNTGAVTATSEIQGASLVPGIEPGGSRAGQATKPALLLRDAWIVINDLQDSSTNDLDTLNVELKLSQELDLTPGLLLGIASVHAGVLGTANQFGAMAINKHFGAAGTLWAPRIVGLRLTVTGFTNVNLQVHLDYERVDVPWMDWFIMWDYLDNVADNARDY